MKENTRRIIKKNPSPAAASSHLPSLLFAADFVMVVTVVMVVMVECHVEILTNEETLNKKDTFYI